MIWDDNDGDGAEKVRGRFGRGGRLGREPGDRDGDGGGGGGHRNGRIMGKGGRTGGRGMGTAVVCTGLF